MTTGSFDTCWVRWNRSAWTLGMAGGICLLAFDILLHPPQARPLTATTPSLASSVASVTKVTATNGDIHASLMSLGLITPSPATDQTSNHSLGVSFQIPEDQASWVIEQLGAKKKVPVEVYHRSMSSKFGDGYLTGTDNQIDPSIGTLTCHAIFNAPSDTVLLPKATVNVRLQLESHNSVTLVPVKAIQRNPQGSFVYLVKADGTVAVRPVTIGVVENDLAEIKDGLAPGDDVVLDVPSDFKDGSAVSE